MATISRIGFGQVEPNHLSAQRTGQIYAQLPCKDDIQILENGQFVKYDYANNQVNTTGKGEWMLVLNEVKLYGDTYSETYKDFAMKKSAYTDGIITPRLFKTNVGDIYTTNAVGAANTAGDAKYDGIDINEKDLLKVGADGWLTTGGDVSSDDMVWEVVKVYTMPDGQVGIKIMRIK